MGWSRAGTAGTALSVLALANRICLACNTTVVSFTLCLLCVSVVVSCLLSYSARIAIARFSRSRSLSQFRLCNDGGVHVLHVLPFAILVAVSVVL